MENINEIKINVPEGMEAYLENNTIKFRCIKKKFTYNQIAKELFENKTAYFITSNNYITHQVISSQYYKDIINCTSEKQAQKFLAINQLMNVAKYLNEGWRPDWEDNGESKYFILIDYYDNKITINSDYYDLYAVVYFKSKELAQQAIDILGEETIRLALCTDY